MFLSRRDLAIGTATNTFCTWLAGYAFIEDAALMLLIVCISFVLQYASGAAIGATIAWLDERRTPPKSAFIDAQFPDNAGCPTCQGMGLTRCDCYLNGLRLMEESVRGCKITECENGFIDCNCEETNGN